MIRVGTRRSALALIQANEVGDGLRARGATVEIVPMRTEGDRLDGAPLALVGGKGLFVREIEESLLASRIDVAVHSLKDLPAELPPGLCLAALPPRADARDVLVTRGGGRLRDLPPGAVVGTSSPRRRALVLAARPDLRVEALRGNVDTRLRKLESAVCDAVILAAAGLRRLGLMPARAEMLDPEDFVPAVGQGIIAVEARVADGQTLAALAALDDRTTRVCAEAERAFLGRLGASCNSPLAAHATVLAGGVNLRLVALVASEDGSAVLRTQGEGSIALAGALGRELADALIERGAADAGAPPSRSRDPLMASVARARPLAGRTIVVTRASAQAQRFVSLLTAAGANVLATPTIAIEPPASWAPLDAALDAAETFTWLVFTSVNGVIMVDRRLTTRRRAWSGFARARVAAIGPATAEALVEHGLRVEIVPREYRAEGLVERLRPELAEGDRVLLPRAAQTRDVLVRELTRLGAVVTEVAAYATRRVGTSGAALRHALSAGTADVVTFTSSSTARNFAELFTEDERRAWFPSLTVASIGPITAATAAEYGLSTRIMPSEYTIPALARAIETYCSRVPPPARRGKGGD